MRLPVTSSAALPNNIWLLSYKEWLSKQPVTANTARIYHSRIKQFLLFLEYAKLESEPLTDPSSANKTMQLYLAFLKESKKEKMTVNANINAFNNFFHFLGLEGLTFTREHCYEKLGKVLTTHEQKEFLRVAGKQALVRDKALALILFYTGLRIGDCAALNMDDIAGGVASIVFKNGSKVILNKATSQALKEWLEERAKLLKAGQKNAAVETETKSALWLTKQGQRLSISGITFVIKRIGWQAKLALSVETLRRTWLTKAAEHLSKDKMASQYGGYISEATIYRHGLLSTSESDVHLSDIVDGLI